jgi:hypothetical protein
MFFWKSEESQITVVGFVFTFFCRTNHATFELTHLNIIHVSPPLVENQLRQARLTSTLTLWPLHLRGLDARTFPAQESLSSD